MTDAELTIDLRDPSPDRLDAQARQLHRTLEDASWDALVEAVTARATRDVVLFTEDGRTLEARVTPAAGRARIALHDVSRHVDHADRFARMTLQLHRQYRNLQVLYDAAVAMSATLDVQALAATAARTVGGYLHAERVTVTIPGGTTVWGLDRRDGPTGTVALHTARGTLGHLSWWRHDGLGEDERETLDALASRCAVALDHALLLMPPEADGSDRVDGLLTPPAARRRLARLRDPRAVALVGVAAPQATDPEAAVASVVRSLAPLRREDVLARWGTDRILVAPEGAPTDFLRRWHDRCRQHADAGTSRWVMGVAEVAGDLDAAIDQAAAALGVARRDGRDLVVYERVAPTA